VVIQYIVFAVILAAAAALAMFLWNVTLLKQVNEKTNDLRKAMYGIRESEEKFKLAFDTSPDSININRLSDGMYIDINQGFTRLTGFTKADVEGKTSADIKIWHDPGDREKLVAGLKAYGFVDNLEAVFTNKDGSNTTALMSAKIMMMNGEPYILSITRDISERKKLEVLMAESEEKFRTLAEQSLIAIAIIQDDVFKYINKGMEVLTGYSRREMEKWAPYEIMNTVAPDFRDLVASQIKKKQAGDRDVMNVYEFKLTAKDGAKKWVNIYSKTITFGGEKAILVSLADISEIKETHEKLEKTIDKLKNSNDELEKFAYATSHDLQEPLRMVSNYLQLLKSKYREKLDAEADIYIDTAVRGAIRMSELIRGILDLSRIRSVEMNFQRVDTGDIVNEAIKMLDAKIKETGAQIVIGKMAEIQADRTRMLQLFMNLIGNAVKFSAKAEKPRVEISCANNGAFWKFCVKDNGVGISAKYFSRIFVAFQTLYSKDEYEGSGIGLATCKKIVEYHNGRIWVESEEGKGASFYFTIGEPH
jgi:PAS domain S-box-containing protein